ncbi:PREDICTED: carbohydrate sulfotransferase 11-like [Priapulus caudatus]|uniref:Carbohydrate sulfotransferase n=1 Tax=Priapulus caudatus TaxID=37621 RepID=A0ABM1F5G0_PRICU|nr:PREDICTED: carbohydrate sulfotransferase 11-like [Priapulus caudatus]
MHSLGDKSASSSIKLEPMEINTYKLLLLPDGRRVATTKQHKTPTTHERPPEYAQRLARIKSVCESNHPIARKLRTQSLEVSRNIIVDDEYKILYCAVGKIACTNWRRVFLSLYDPARFPDPRNITIKSAHTVKLRQLSDYKWDEQVHRLDTYYKFMFARHPFERLASAYRSKFTYDLPYNRQYHRHYGTRIIEYYRPDASPQSLAEGKDVRFDEFLKFLADPESDSVDQNRHWSHVYHACNPCQITYDLVGKMETLERDAAQVIREAGVPSLISFPTREDAKYQNKMASEIVGELMAGVAPSLVQQIYRVYELDFSMFGYEWPIRGT